VSLRKLDLKLLFEDIFKDEIRKKELSHLFRNLNAVSIDLDVLHSTIFPFMSGTSFWKLQAGKYILRTYDDV